MRKMKKILAGIVSAAMVLSSLTLTAFAAQTTPATIDTSKTGSLTIHKYEYNGSAGSEGTGSESDEIDKIPEGANKLAGAGFTIYKVADVKDLTNYYSTDPTALPPVENYVENGKIKDGVAKWTSDEITTTTDGVVSFTGLDLGLYVVIETKTPAAVTKPMKPFIVSVPMTTVDGDNWLYDIHVFPKNGTSYAGVTLEKLDGKGKGLAGVTFALQKQKADGTWTDITKKAGASGDNTGDDLNLVTSTLGTISVDGLTQGTYRFIETSVGDNHGYIMDGATAYTFTVNSDKTVTYGNETGTSVTIQANNYKPDLTKEVKDRTELTWGQDSDYNVGDLIDYKVTVDVPENITKLVDFVVTDTPTHLEDKFNTVTLTCKGAAVADAAYTKAATTGGGFVVTFDPAEMEAYAGKQIVIEYKAELLSTAVTTTEGNPNTAKLEYSNAILPDSSDKDNPNTPDKPETRPGKDVIKDNAIVYTFKLNILKTGENNTKLKDVVFDLYKEVPEGTAGAVAGNSDNGLDTSEYWLKIDTLTTDADGEVSKSGLANGTYYLVETKTNADYNLLKAPVEVELNVAYATSMTATWNWTEDEYGVKTLVKHEITTSETTFTGTDDPKATDGYKAQTIINKKGFELPTTGGMGTLMFAAIGVMLMLGGALVLFKSSKKRA